MLYTAGMVRLAWRKPAQSSPQTIKIPARSSSYNGFTVVRMSTSRDYIIQMPREKKIGGIELQGGRHIHLIRAHVCPNPLRINKHKTHSAVAVLVTGSTGIVHIEGLRTDSTTLNGPGDAIQIRAPKAVVQVQNCFMDKVLGGITNDEVHADVVQLNGSDEKNPRSAVRELRIDRLTATTNVNGLQFENFGPTKVKRVNLSYWKAPRGIHIYGLLGRFADTIDGKCSYSTHYLQDVYFDPTVKGVPLAQAVNPRAQAGYWCRGWVDEIDGSVRWPTLPIDGFVRLGESPGNGGDYVLGEGQNPGVNYVSPGYF